MPSASPRPAETHFATTEPTATSPTLAIMQPVAMLSAKSCQSSRSSLKAQPINAGRSTPTVTTGRAP